MTSECSRKTFYRRMSSNVRISGRNGHQAARCDCRVAASPTRTPLSPATTGKWSAGCRPARCRAIGSRDRTPRTWGRCTLGFGTTTHDHRRRTLEVSILHRRGAHVKRHGPKRSPPTTDGSGGKKGTGRFFPPTVFVLPSSLWEKAPRPLFPGRTLIKPACHLYQCGVNSSYG